MSELDHEEAVEREERRDDRRDKALWFMSGGGIAMSAIAAFTQWQLAEAKAIWPLLYMGLSAMGLIAIVFTTYGFILGRVGLRIEATRQGLKLEDGAGQP